MSYKEAQKKYANIGIDTPADLAAAEKYLGSQTVTR